MDQAQRQLAINEIKALARRMGPEHVQQFQQADASGGFAAIVPYLVGYLSRDALEVARAVYTNSGGFHGLVNAVDTDIRADNESYAAQWLHSNGIRPDPNAPNATSQVTSLIGAAQAAGVQPVEMARHLGLADAQTPAAQDPADAAAEAAAVAERAKVEKNPALAGSEVQEILGRKDFHIAAAKLGTNGPTLMKKLLKDAETGDFVKVAEQSNGLFPDASAAREVLSLIGNAAARDRLAQKMSTRDGPSVPERTEPNDDDDRRADVVASARKHDRPDPSKQITEVDSGRKFDVMRSYREHTGQSLKGVRPTARVASEVRRDEAKGLREKIHETGSRHDDIRASIRELNAASRGPDEAARLEQARTGAVELADRLEADAERESA